MTVATCPANDSAMRHNFQYFVMFFYCVRGSKQSVFKYPNFIHPHYLPSYKKNLLCYTAMDILPEAEFILNFELRRFDHKCVSTCLTPDATASGCRAFQIA